MKSKYLQIKKREKAYHAACDKAEQRYIAEVFELVRHECEKWGLEFYAGNGGYNFTLPSANKYLIRTKSAAGYLEHLNQPGDDLIELICPELFEILEAHLYSSGGRCCVGCQISEYTNNLPNNDLVCVQSNELEIDYRAIPEGNIVSLDNAKEISYGPIQRNLAEAILSAENAHRYFQLFDEFNVNYQEVAFP